MNNFTDIVKEARKNYDSESLLNAEITTFLNKVNKVITNDNILELRNNQICHIGAKYKTNFMEVFKNGNFTNNLDSINNREYEID
jgi:hypothetical protein